MTDFADIVLIFFFLEKILCPKKASSKNTQATVYVCYINLFHKDAQ